MQPVLNMLAARTNPRGKNFITKFPQQDHFAVAKRISRAACQSAASPPMATGANGGGPVRVTLEAAVPAAACEGEAWAELASAWTLEAVRAALRSVA